MSSKFFVQLHRDAEKALYKMPSHMLKRIEKVIDDLEVNPYLGAKLHGELSYLRKVKVSNYRVIYQIFESELLVFIEEIASRGNVSYDR